MDTIYSSEAPEPVGLYPHARRAGNLLFLSGVGPRVRGSQEIPGVILNTRAELESYDFPIQCHAVFRNVRAILEASGARWENLVDITVFLISMKNDFKVFNEIYATYFQENRPCRTTVEVNALPTPIAIELKCIALL